MNRRKELNKETDEENRIKEQEEGMEERIGMKKKEMWER